MKTHYSHVRTLALVLVVAIGPGMSASDEKRGTPDESARAESATSSETEQSKADENVETQSESDESSETTNRPNPAGPYAQLQQMDGRKPVPLTPMMANHQRQNMREHLVAVQEIIAATSRDDFEGVEEAAEKIGSSPQMKQMCNHMGAGAEGFTERALGFHEKADGIIEAAKAKDKDGVMTSLHETLATCTSCHAQYKQKVVSPGEWNDITGMGAPSGGGMHGH
jgi:uncharacterized damage-inducible protein DinB